MSAMSLTLHDTSLAADKRHRAWWAVAARCALVPWERIRRCKRQNTGDLNALPCTLLYEDRETTQGERQVPWRFHQ